MGQGSLSQNACELTNEARREFCHLVFDAPAVRGSPCKEDEDFPESERQAWTHMYTVDGCKNPFMR
jgi:hypothetical protein